MIESFSDLQKCRYGSVLVRILLLPLKFFQPGIHLCNLLFDIPLEPFSFGHALLKPFDYPLKVIGFAAHFSSAHACMGRKPRPLALLNQIRK
jgi:hypothetical protein